MDTLFTIAQGEVITATLSFVLSIDSTICFAPDFILENDVREIYGLPSLEIAKQIDIDLSRPQHRGQHPWLPGVSNSTANFPLDLNRYPRPIPLTRLSIMYRTSIPFAANRPVKDQHRWLPLSALLGPSSILLTNIKSFLCEK